MAEARTESLLTAYEKAAIRLEKAAIHEISGEVEQFCHAQERNAVASFIQMMHQKFTGLIPAHAQDAIAQQISRDASGISSRLVRELARTT
jgi:hypothetical protein